MQHGVFVSSTSAVVATCPTGMADEIRTRMMESGLVSGVHALPDATMILVPKQGVMAILVTTTLAKVVANLRVTVTATV